MPHHPLALPPQYARYNGKTFRVVARTAQRAQLRKINSTRTFVVPTQSITLIPNTPLPLLP